jgi:hypothetical protein
MNISHLLQLTVELIQNSKIHFAIGEKQKSEPMLAFYRNIFQEWQAIQSNRNFEQDYILSLIYLTKYEWLFAGIYKRLAVLKVGGKRFQYTTELTPIGSEFNVRLIVQFNKRFRNSYPYLAKYISELEVLEIRRERYTLEPFPGFDRVCVQFDLLKTIIAQEEVSWKTALTNVKGI